MKREVTQRKRSALQKRFGFQLSRIARKQVLVALLLGTLSLVGRAVLLRFVPIPKPGIQDEFSYLLAADTYASGRLTNPKHPLWIHFETVHLIVQPTYQSKYPPVQGMLLGIGQVIFGDPWFGVWLSMGVMSAAIYWALAGWLPPKWAALGGVLALIHVGFFNYWSESYWGGSAAAAAGALVIGAVPRLRRKPSTKTAILLGSGLALLANTRPFEGAVLGMLCIGTVLMKVPIKQLAVPFAITLIPAALGMMYYNYRVTGDPLRMPYMEHERQYATSSPFIWQSRARPAPHYNHEALRATYVGWDQALRARARAHPFLVRTVDFLIMDDFFLGLPLTLCVVGFVAGMLAKPHRTRLAVLLLLLFMAGLELEVTVLPHYAAPATALVYIAATSALRRLRHFSPFWFQGVVALIVLSDITALASPGNRWLYDKRDFIARRQGVLRRLDQSPGKQLVLVEYGKGHDVNQEWVYNRADIDRSRIVWARGMGAERDRELLEYYPDRQVWRLVDHGDEGVDLSRLDRPAERAHAVVKR